MCRKFCSFCDQKEIEIYPLKDRTTENDTENLFNTKQSIFYGAVNLKLPFVVLEYTMVLNSGKLPIRFTHSKFLLSP